MKEKIFIRFKPTYEITNNKITSTSKLQECPGAMSERFLNTGKSALGPGMPDLPDFPENFRIFPVSEYFLYDELCLSCSFIF
jgi:hypothetical protein